MCWHLHGHSSSCFCFHLIHYANVGYPVAEGTVQPDFSDFAFTLPADDTLAARILNENPATIVGNILFGIIPVTQALNVMFYVSTGTFQRYCVKGHLFLENWSEKKYWNLYYTHYSYSVWREKTATQSEEVWLLCKMRDHGFLFPVPIYSSCFCLNCVYFPRFINSC